MLKAHKGIVSPVAAMQTAAAGGGGGYRYFRLHILGVTGVAYQSVNVLALWVGGVDKALMTEGGTVSSSGGFDEATFPLIAAFDGDVSTRYMLDSSATFPKWLQRSLPAPISPTSFTLVQNNDGNGPSAFELRGSNDITFATFTTLKSVSGLTATDWTGNSYVEGNDAGLTWPIP